MKTTLLGDIAEVSVIKKALQKGWQVAKPFGNAYKYDLIINDGAGFKRVQIKHMRLKNGILYRETTHRHYKNGKYDNTQYQKDEIDLFAFYSKDLDKIYIMPFTEKVSISLRIEPPKNNQKKDILYAKDFELN